MSMLYPDLKELHKATLREMNKPRSDERDDALSGLAWCWVQLAEACQRLHVAHGDTCEDIAAQCLSKVYDEDTK